MDQEALHVRYLVVIAAVLCALIIGYNAFYVPDASMSTITVAVDSSASSEEYTPNAPSESNLEGMNSGAASQAKRSVASAKPASSAASKNKGKVNINTATAQQLSDGLNGVGAVMAKRIVAYREKNGAFHSIQQLKNVSGIGDKTFEKLKDQITVN